MSLNDSLMKGFVKYYNTLSKVGYINKTSVNKLIIGSWINKVFNGEYSIIINNEQYNLLSNLYLCIAGDCLVPYSKYCTDVVINKLPTYTYFRITEINSHNRITEDDDLRIL